MHPSTDTWQPPPGGPRGRWRPSKRLLIGLVVLIVIAIAVALAIAAGGDDSDDGLPQPTTLSPPPSGTSDLPDQTIPDEAPPGIRWETYQGVALPYSDTAGPRRIEDQSVSGFAHSPIGVLLASEHIPHRAITATGDGWRKVTEEGILPGPGRDAYVRARSQITGPYPVPPGGYGQTAAFRFIAYTPDIAVIQSVDRFPGTGNLQLITQTLRWVDDDWRLELQPDGSNSPPAQRLSSIDGFIPWGGI